MKKFLLTLAAVVGLGFAIQAKEVTDIINYAALGLDKANSNYAKYEITNTNSGAEYTLNCGANNALGINANTGFIVSTLSPGTVKSVQVTSTSGAKLNVYAQNEAFVIPEASFNKDNVNAMLGDRQFQVTLTDGEGSGTFDSSFSYVGFNASGTFSITQLSITWEVPDSGVEYNVETPAISFDKLTNTVSISCATSGATIYYTTNGETPSTSSSVYNNPFTITETVTVNAYATKGSDISKTATLKCNYFGTFTNYADYIKANPTTGGRVQGPITVIYQNGTNLYTQDKDGGFMLLYGAVDATLTNGDVLSYIEGTYAPYNGLPEITTPEVGTVTTGGEAVVPVVTSLPSLNGASLNSYVKVKGVTISKAQGDSGIASRTYTLTDADNKTAVLFNTFYNGKPVINVPVPEEGKEVTAEYNIVGFVGVYNGTRQLTPISFILTSEDNTPETEPEPGDEPGDEEGVIFSESFATSLGDFKTVDVDLAEGMTFVWTFASGYGAKASAFVNNSNQDAQSWLVSPVIDLTAYENVVLNLDQAVNYAKGNKVSDYCQIFVGNANTEPSAKEWINITNLVNMPEGDNWTFVNSGDVPLTDFEGKQIKIGFLYTSTTEVGMTWEIKNLVVSGEESTDSDAINEVATDLNAPVEYYNLQGVRVNNPVKGGLYIIRQGKTAKKAIIR